VDPPVSAPGHVMSGLGWADVALGQALSLTLTCTGDYVFCLGPLSAGLNLQGSSDSGEGLASVWASPVAQTDKPWPAAPLQGTVHPL
jgi:hypothetical protein